MTRVALACLLLIAAPLAGCVGGDEKEGEDLSTSATDEIGEEAQRRLRERVEVPKDYVIRGQRLLAETTAWLNGTIDFAANAAVEDRNDRGGNKYNSILVENDVSQYIPPGQPVEMQVTLYYFGGAGSTADVDLLVDVPGFATDWSGDNNDEMNWKGSVQRLTLNTVGVPGERHIVGVQAANGRTAPGSSLDYAVRVEVRYAKDALTPFVPYAIPVPANATGIILESVKAGGDEHVRAAFVVIDPDDELVGYYEYDDLAIPTESMFIPATVPGDYVFYAYRMEGGFLHARSDAPLAASAVRPLTRVVDRVVDHTGPAPGSVERDLGCVSGVCAPQKTPYAEGTQTSFHVSGAFPLDVSGFFDAKENGGTVASEVRISSPKGLVFGLHRMARYDDARGSLGYTNDQGPELVVQRDNLAKGAYTVGIVNDGDLDVGHVIVTYGR